MRPAAFVIATVVALAGPSTQFRFARPLATPAGWVRVELPDDVLDACRPGLPDLRIADQGGREIPFAFEQDLAASSRRLPIENLESVARTETTGIVDRGPTPGFADAVTFEIGGTDFLKPVTIQGSDDGSAWRDVVKGSIFATGAVRMLTLRIPENDRRYFRFRFDDRNGPPVHPDALLVRARVPGSGVSTAERPAVTSPLPSDGDGWSRYSAVLPAANLSITELRFRAKDPAFSREVRVYERILFRDEVYRRLVAEGTLKRAPGNEGAIDLPMVGSVGKNLEVEIENGDSPPLEDLEIAALVRGRILRFLAPEGAGLRMLYGSSAASPPKYDLVRALEGGVPEAAAEATLGAPIAMDGSSPSLAATARAPLADSDKWTSRRPIQLPAAGVVAYLDFYDLPRGLADLRIVDGTGLQVPFVVEQGSHEHRQSVRWDVATKDTRTTARIKGLANEKALDAIELTASGPEYFSREVRIIEEQRDGRGVTGDAVLGAARWERKPGEPARVLRIPIQRPRGAPNAIRVEIENGDNGPLALTGASALTSAVRIDFLFRGQEALFLLSGNDGAPAPAYDLEMLAGRILSSPAAAASLGPELGAAPAKARFGGWLWAAIAVAALLLLFELARTLKRAV